MNTQKTFSVGRWVLLTSIGFFAGILLVLVFAAISESLNIDFQFPIAMAMGLGIGALQWLMLRKRFDHAANWIWLLTAGLCIPFLLFDVFGKYLHLSEWFFLVDFSLGGILGGYLQYRFFLSSRLYKATNWVYYNAAAWIFCPLLASAISIPYLASLGKTLHDTINMIVIFGCGPVLGLITGYGLRSIVGTEKID
jgi:hypothetical protein